MTAQTSMASPFTAPMLQAIASQIPSSIRESYNSEANFEAASFFC